MAAFIVLVSSCRVLDTSARKLDNLFSVAYICELSRRGADETAALVLDKVLMSVQYIIRWGKPEGACLQ